MSARILVVDDKKADRMAVSRVLKNAGYQIHQAKNGQECLRLTRKHNPDLILLDVNLPDSSGMDICQQIKAEEGLKGVFIVMLSSVYTDTESQAKGLESGADGYINRPISNRELLARVDAMLRIKAAEDALKAGEKRFGALMENSADAISLLDVKGRLVYDSPAAPGMLGYDKEEWLEKDFFKLVHTDELQKTKAQFKSLTLTRGARVQSIFRLRHKNGSWLWIDAVATNLLDKPGVNAIVVNYRDITERMRADTSLRESEERYSQLMNLSLEPIYMFDPKTMNVLEANPAFGKLLGYRASEIQRLTAYDVVAHERESIDRLTARVLKLGATDIGERQWRCKDGTIVSVLVTANKIKVKDADIIFVTGHNITERKQIEEALRDREQRLQAIIENEPECIKLVAPDGILLQMNPAGLAMIEADDEQAMLGKSIYPIITAEYRQAFRDLTDRVCKGESGKLSFEIVGLKGTRRWLDTHAVPMRNEHGDVIGSLGITRDITERKRAEESLRESEQRYRALFEDMPVAIWEEDFYDVKKYLDSLKAQGVTDFRAYFEHNPETFLECAALIKVLDVNQATLKMYHADSKEDLYKSMDDGLSESEAEHLRDALIAISEGKTSHNWEGVGETVTGEPIEVSLSWAVAPGHEADFSKVIVTTLDITARKRAEEALRTSEEKYRLIIENAGEALYVVQNGLIVFANPMFEKIAELPASELIGKSIMEFLPAQEDRMAALKSHLRLLRGKIANAHSEYKVRLRSGAERWIDLSEVRTTWEGELAALTFATDITDRKQAEEALQESGAFIRAVMDNLPIGVAVNSVDPAVDFIYMNDNFPKYYRTTRESLADPDVFWDAVYEETDFREEIKKRVLDDVASGNPERMHWNDVPITRKGGETTFISAMNTPAPGKKLMISTVWDVTERKQAEENLRQRVAELELLYESGLAISQLLSPKEIGQKIIDLLEQKMNWHHTAIRLYNAEDETLELLAFHQPGIKSAAERLAVEARFKSMVSRSSQGLSGWVIQHGETVRTGNLINDGRYVETFAGLHSGLYVPIKIGERTIGVISIESEKENTFSKSDEQLTIILAAQAASIFENARLYEDTIQRAAELEQRVAERTAQIEATKRRLELATYAGQIGVWEYNPRENKAFWDERMHMIHGIPVGGFDGTYQAWAKLIHPDDIEKQQINIQLAVTKNLLSSNEHRILWPDGSVRHIMTSAITAYSPDGTPERIIGINMDITEHKKAEEAQRLAKSEMERALRIKNEFLANMSHELRTPLNAILGISESLEEQIAGALNEKQLKYIRVVKESGRHLLELINDILDLSKIEAGRMELNIHKVSVEMLCQSSLRMVKELAQKKSLDVSLKIDGEVKVILADERRLKQSLVNLLSNAVKFTPNGREIGLEVNGHPQLNEVTFTVWDRGVGIAGKNIQYIFKPFVQLDASLAREYQGTGLGLALVAQMINLQGGHVNVESELGQGSRFTITLPWPQSLQTPQAKVTAKLAFPSPRSNEKRIGTLRVLLVEDTEVVIQLVNEYLKYKGYEVINARNGREAVQLAAQERPDLILMDVMMPVMDGLEATRQIRKDKTLQSVPIIALTALAMSGDDQRCLDAGMNDYMSKPIQMQALSDMIEKYLKPATKE